MLPHDHDRALRRSLGDHHNRRLTPTSLMSPAFAAVLLLAGLCVSPSLTKVTVGPVSAELTDRSTVGAFAQAGQAATSRTSS